MTTSRWASYVYRRLDEIEEGQGDFTGLQRPDQVLVARARYIAGTVFAPTTPTPSVVPTEDGEVAFIWRKGGWHLQLTVNHRHTEVWAHHVSSGNIWSGALSLLLTPVQNLLKELEDSDAVPD